MPPLLICVVCGFAVVGLWRMFASENEVKIGVEPCNDGEEGWYETVAGNFRIPERPALETILPAGPSLLAALGTHPTAVVGCKVQKAKR
ncbi:hypothetical protein HanIR_Chr16g0845021 [Helianthus annuus]|nr:hypothetical protein HanIR_Chr16g0845021 [Helianthus annuus]